MRKTFLAAVAFVACGAVQVSIAAPMTAALTGGAGTSASWAAAAQRDMPPASVLDGPSFDALVHQREPLPTVDPVANPHEGTQAASTARVRVHVDTSSGVPEPGTLALLAAGVGTFAFLRRRRFDS